MAGAFDVLVGARDILMTKGKTTGMLERTDIVKVTSMSPTIQIALGSTFAQDPVYFLIPVTDSRRDMPLNTLTHRMEDDVQHL